MNEVVLLGYAAAILTSLSFLPQAWVIIRTGRTDGISLLMYSVFTIGVSFWLIYGVTTHSAPIVAANAVTLTLALIILSLTAKNRLAARRKQRA